jgi:hypothetical protein
MKDIPQEKNIGAFVSSPDISGMITLLKPAGATQISMQASLQNMRFRLDGEDPTASTGFVLPKDSAPMVIFVLGKSIKLIPERGTANLQYQWIGRS